jgi:hypothetical protein
MKITMQMDKRGNTMKATKTLTLLLTGAVVVAPAFAADLKVQAVAVNGTPLASPQSAVDVTTNDAVTVAFFLDSWGPDSVRAYQVQIDSAGYVSGTTGMLTATVPAIDDAHAEFIFSGAGQGIGGAFSVVDQSQANTRWASALSDPTASVPYGGSAQYLGELILNVSADASGTFTVDVASAGTFLRDEGDPPGDIAFVDGSTSAVRLSIVQVCECDAVAHCIDLDANNVIDDVCTWGRCDASPCGSCTVIQKAVPADISGPFGACMPDTFCNVHDRNQALSCFSGVSSCERINIDAGGAFGTCAADGFCNIHDANAALSCFAGTTTCVCGASPEGPAPLTVDTVDITVVAPRRAYAGEYIEVVIETDNKLHALQAYQLEVQVSGGRAGVLKLDHIEVEDRKSAALPAGPDRFEATNAGAGQMLVGTEQPGRGVRAGAYLATYVYRVSSDADGSFVIDVLHDEAVNDQTFFVAPGNHRIGVNYVTSARVDVARRAKPRR